MNTLRIMCHSFKLQVHRYCVHTVSLWQRKHTSFVCRLFVISTLCLLVAIYLESEWCHADMFYNKYVLAISALLSSNGIDTVIGFGGCLGLIRGNQLMPHDYDIDYLVMAEDTSKLLSLKPAFSALGFEVYGRNEFIWHKLGGDSFQITSPILRLYISKTQHIEFYELHDETVQSAKQSGYDISGSLSTLKDDTKLLCMVPEEPCFEKRKVLPLKKWNWSLFNVDLMMPNDPEYFLSRMYGENWRIPYLKGWKHFVCFQQWSLSSVTTVKALLILWYLLLCALCLFHMKSSKNKSQDTPNSEIDAAEKEYLIVSDREPNKRV
mmetsp:Transcript_62219/g.98975  ORF Transcript_62219/g.98975 Transcript_62219/m.98975 type:complete len:322 (+) Transcript_62219:70-1035(+)